MPRQFVLNRNIGVGWQMTCGFVAVIACGLAGYLSATRAIDGYVSRTRTAAQSSMATISTLKDLEDAVHADVDATNAYILSRDPKYKAAIDAATTNIDRLEQALKAQRAASTVAADVAVLTGPLQHRIVELVTRGDTTQAAILFNGPHATAADRFDADANRFADGINHASRTAEWNDRLQLNKTILAGWLTPRLISLLIAIFIVRAISLSMRRSMSAEVALRIREERFRALSKNASDVTVIIDHDRRMSFVDAAAERNWGFDADTLRGAALLDHVHPDDHLRVEEMIDRAEASPSTDILCEARMRHSSGGWCPNEIIANDLTAEPSIEGIVLTCRDISERQSLEEELLHQALHDALTGLPNRALFTERLSHALTRAQRGSDLVGVCMIDIDNFKVVNDSLGHRAGDQLIVLVTERLREGVRAGDTVARLGGDEFAILFENLAGEEEAIKLIDRVTAELSQPIAVEGHSMFVTISTGIAVGDAVEQDPGRLLRNADIAMYRAKTNGKARLTLFDDSMTGDALERLELEADLRDAIDHGQLRVYYQPIVDLVSGRVAEVEALVRWEHPTRGLIPPLKFIPIAEETGLIVPLGLWVMREACRQTKVWQDEFPRQSELMVGVNLSARQLDQADLIDEVSAILLETGLMPGSLRLEITESLTVENAEWTQMRLRALKSLGVKLAVDDFGTGYSSMAYLSSFPIDTLKIDRCFVNKIAEPEGTAIVQAIITLACSLGLNVTGEGIESLDQLKHLQTLGCHEGQGYYFSRPVTGDAMAGMLARTQLMPGDKLEPASKQRLAA